MSDERKLQSPPQARSVLGLTPPAPAAHSQYARNSPSPGVLSPRAQAAAAVAASGGSSSNLGAMFPHLPHDVIIFELDQNNRELERTITALLAHSERAGSASAAVELVESDEAVAKRLQAELDAESARSVHHGAGAGARRGSGGAGAGGTGEDIDEEELMRLKLAQFAHREAIYQGNAEGPFAPKGAAAAVAAADAATSSPARSGFLLKKGGKVAANTLSPMERIARDRRIYESSFHNRVASEEEIVAAKEGPKAMRKLQEKRKKEAEAMAAMQAMGFTVSRPQQEDPHARSAEEIARANQAMLAARKAAAASTSGAGAGVGEWNAPHAMAAPMQLPPTYLSGQRAAAASSAAVAPYSAAAAAPLGSTAPHTHAFDVEKERKHKKKKSKHKEGAGAGTGTAGTADSSSDSEHGASAKKRKKERKKEKEKEKEGEGDGKKKKKHHKDKDKDKDRERQKEGERGIASPSAPGAPSAASAAAPSASSPAAPSAGHGEGQPADLVDLLRNYSLTPSSRRIDAEEINTLLKK